MDAVFQQNARGTELGGPAGLSKETVLRLLTEIGEALTTMLGEWCEVVVHDVTDLEHSIVSISGNVTGRKVGGHMPDLGLALLGSGQTKPVINYTNYTDDGKRLKSSSIFIHAENGEPVGTLCINLDITTAFLFERHLRTLASETRGPNVTEFFSEDLGQTVETIIAECAYQVGKSVSVMTKSDRVKVVQLLGERGIFRLKKSIPLVARRLGVTQKTIYNYLAELAEETE